MNLKSYVPAAIVLVVIAVLHAAGAEGEWYFEYWWLDILLHFLGGVWVAMTGFWFFYNSRIFAKTRHEFYRYFLATLGLTLIIGGLWEVFEYAVGLTFVLPGETYVQDMVGDIFVDSAGALTVYLYYRLKNWKKFC